MLVGGFIHEEGEIVIVLLREVEPPYCGKG